MRTHDQYNGIFLSGEGTCAGHLNISGAGSLVKLIGNRIRAGNETEYADIHGVLEDGKKASLLSSVLRSLSQRHVDGATQFVSVYFPNYVVVGEEFIRSDEAVVRAVRYHFENVTSLLGGHKTFRSIRPDPAEVRNLLEADHKRSEKIGDEYGWPKIPFDPEIGTYPQLLYFSGVGEIIATDTEFGRVSLANRTSYGLGTAAGIGIDNEVTANIEFIRPKTVKDAIEALYTLHGLFEISLGRLQRYLWIELELTHQSNYAGRDLYQQVQLYWSLCNERVYSESTPIPADILLAPDRRHDEFVKVAAGWMDSAATMGESRERFATGFFGGYSINRIVGAANMFDLLPEAHAPKKKECDPLLMEAVEQCRKTFKNLPDSFAKQSVLSSLGRVGVASLRDKVHHRADKVMAVVGNRFPDLHLPCNHAVLARNHYVHGSRASFDYRENFTEFAFITDTLEFVFAASDLLDLGWDLEGWMGHGKGMTHSFSAYVVNYARNISKLRALVGR